MAIVTVERRDDGWWLVPDPAEHPLPLPGATAGPYESESRADAAAADYLIEVAPGGLGDDPMGPPRHGRGSVDDGER